MKRSLIVLMLATMALLLVVTGCQNPAVTSAKIYLNTNQDPDKAIEQCKLAIEQVPSDPEAYYLMGRAYSMKKMFPEMNDAFAQSLERGAKFQAEINQERNVQWAGLLNAGVAHYQNDKPVEAVEKFEMATTILPEKPNTWKYLGSARAQAGNNAGAIAAFKKAIELEGSDWESYYQMANLYYAEKNYEEAINNYTLIIDKAGASSKFYADAMSRAGICYDILGQPEKAQAIYEKALTENPDDMNMRFNMGRIFLQQKNYEKALEMFQPVYDANPDDYENAMSLGWTTIELKKNDDAIKYFLKATELKPENHQAWFWLGTAYVRAGDGEKGKMAFDKADALKKAE